MAEPAAGCGCQYDAAGRVFVDHCICPPRDATWSDAGVAALLAECDERDQSYALHPVLWTHEIRELLGGAS